MERIKVIPRNVVLDTSVVIKWYRTREDDVEKAKGLRKLYLEGKVSLIVPDLLLYEIANVLRYKIDLSSDDVELALRSLVSMRVSVVAPSVSTLTRAIRLAYQCDITVYDAYFLALVVERGYNLVTGDAKFFEKIAHFGNVLLLSQLKF